MDLLGPERLLLSGIGATVTPFASASSTTESSYSQSVNVDTKFLASFRGKLGFAIGNFLPYITAGLAIARYDIRAASQLNLSNSDVSIEKNVGIGLASERTFKETAFGAVVGGGVSTVAFQNVIVSIEGLYCFFDDEVNVTSGFLNSEGVNIVSLDDIIEGRLKISVPLN